VCVHCYVVLVVVLSVVHNICTKGLKDQQTIDPKYNDISQYTAIQAKNHTLGHARAAKAAFVLPTHTQVHPNPVPHQSVLHEHILV